MVASAAELKVGQRVRAQVGGAGAIGVGAWRRGEVFWRTEPCADPQTHTPRPLHPRRLLTPACATCVPMGVRCVRSWTTRIVRFLGKTAFAEGEWVGVELVAAVGKHAGEVREPPLLPINRSLTWRFTPLPPIYAPPTRILHPTTPHNQNGPLLSLFRSTGQGPALFPLQGASRCDGPACASIIGILGFLSTRRPNCCPLRYSSRHSDSSRPANPPPSPVGHPPIPGWLRPS